MENKKSNIKKNRKFLDFDYFRSNGGGQYYLLPFRFHRINVKKEVMVNEVGDFLIVPSGTVEKIVTRKLDLEKESELFADLLANFFISEDKIPALIDIAATRFRTKKSFLDNFTSLHIFVISLRCEHTCHYCQVSRVTSNKTSFDMSRNHIDKGIDLMMMSPSENLTMEFQGGEALLAFESIVYAIEKTKIRAQGLNKNMTYVICTNLSLITDEILNYCRTENILISTSLDGPAFLHNANRHRPGNNSYELTIEGVEKCRSALGNDRISALLTTTTLSLEYPVQIVDEYFKHNFNNIFLRPISPYGFAKYNDKKNSYLVERFLTFYKKALDRIIEYNLNGHFFREEYATIILKKVLSPFPVGYVDLQSPAGMINNVIVFNYDGKVYASDESRMLAENNDYTFCLGDLDNSNYDDIFFNDYVSYISDFMVNESLAGCSECAFQSYCGADPVFHYATQNDMYGHRADSLFCKKNMEIIRHLFELLDNDPKIKDIFYNWINF